MGETGSAMTDSSALREREIRFPEGIPGFATARRFELIDLNDSSEAAFQLLKGIDAPAVSLIVTHPWLFFPDYAPEIDEQTQLELEITDAADAVVFCPVTIEGDQVFVNLLGPFVVNTSSLHAKQVVLADSHWPIKALIELDVDDG